MRRLVVATALLAVLAVLAPAASAAPVLGLLSVSPPQAAPGVFEEVQGHGISPFAGVSLRLVRMPDGQGDCRNGQPVLQLDPAFADEHGDISASFVLPGQINGAATAPGTYCVLGLYTPGVYVYGFLQVNAPPPSGGPNCGFVLGFAQLQALIPGPVGQCLDDEQHNGLNGDGLQHTSGGLLVWRKADNWTAFTDGYRTWVNGLYGLQTRLNSQHFLWEGTGGSGAGPDVIAPVPAGTLDRYYDLLDQGNYAAAYAMWQAPPQPFAAFAAGFSGNGLTAIRTGRPRPDSAAGHIGVDIPTVVIARQADGSVQAFGGCYILAAIDPYFFMPPAPQPFKLQIARIQPLPGVSAFSDTAAQQALASGCSL